MTRQDYRALDLYLGLAHRLRHPNGKSFIMQK